ncbi:DUF3396 domain-containing protein [Pseudenhygromyxa sp. WMMC2535]|uniref:type VI immunity family protein n=1 Tax=Pseudenhygromyxa sp. WMMC2535 TaxID=2712867 RepID=UPI0015548851|nr:type VI immunity family protein [Pseudenhygromyxa sp. WMMC2535]NVB37718.1 DUF3396 domain-containing protein [Pseudenhygromyxa sp. WMMC2535]
MLTTLSVDLAVHLDHPISTYGDEVIQLLAAYERIVPSDVLRWYATETMSLYKPKTARTLKLPASWWRKGSKQKPYRSLKVHGAEHPSSTSPWGVRLVCEELRNGERRKAWHPSLLRFSFSPQWFEKNRSAYLELAQRMAERLPFASGHGGYSLEHNWVYESISTQAAYALARRYIGIDLDHNVTYHAKDFLRSFNWLTMTGKTLLERTNLPPEKVVAALPDEASCIETDLGLMIFAGEWPQLGDVNRGELLPLHRTIAKCLQPLFSNKFQPAFLLRSPDDHEKSLEWYRRFLEDIPDEA